MIMVSAEKLYKSFVLHLQGGLSMPVLEGDSLTLAAGECVALTGQSGAGKSTFMRAIYGNYRVDQGRIMIRHRGEMIDLAQASPRAVIEMRQETLGYVSQFLRVVPRVPARDIVSEPLVMRGQSLSQAREKAEELLLRLNIPCRLHDLAPATFSGGEQQRINLARGFIGGHPVLLLDEPTASLDEANAEVVASLIQEAKHAGVALLGIFHDTSFRRRVMDREIEITQKRNAAEPT